VGRRSRKSQEQERFAGHAFPRNVPELLTFIDYVEIGGDGPPIPNRMMAVWSNPDYRRAHSTFRHALVALEHLLATYPNTALARVSTADTSKRGPGRPPKDARNQRIKELSKLHRTESPTELTRIAATDVVIQGLGETPTAEAIRSLLKPRKGGRKGR